MPNRITAKEVGNALGFLLLVLLLLPLTVLTIGVSVMIWRGLIG